MKKYKSVDDLFKSIEEERKKHPIRTFFNRLRYEIRNIINIPSEIYDNVKWFIQRGMKGYSERDVWNFHHYISSLLKNALIDLKDKSYGYPDDMTEEEWKEVLNQIIYTFHTAELICEGNYLYVPSYKFDEKEYKKHLKYCQKEDWVLMSKEDVLRFENGLDLFKKYYFKLYD